MKLLHTVIDDLARDLVNVKDKEFSETVSLKSVPGKKMRDSGYLLFN